MTAVVTDLALVNEPGSYRRCFVVTAVDQTDRRFFVKPKYPKEHFVQIGQIDYKAVPPGRLVVPRVERPVVPMEIVVALVAAVAEPEDQAQASKLVWILEVVALPEWQPAAELVGVRLEVGMEGNVAAAGCEFLRPRDPHQHLVQRLHSDPYYQIVRRSGLWHGFQA